MRTCCPAPFASRSSFAATACSRAQVGVGLLAWSRGGKFLVSRNDNMPRALWVWEGETLLLHSLLLQQGPVLSAAWHPSQQLLAICTGSSKVFMWSPKGCRTAPLPIAHELEVTELSWSPQGDALLLLDNDRFCVCFLALPSDGATSTGSAATGGTEAAAGCAEAEAAEESQALAEALAALAAAADGGEGEEAEAWELPLSGPAADVHTPVVQ